MARVIDQFEKKKNEEETKRKSRGWDFEDIQVERPTAGVRRKALNEQESVFSSAMEKGINTEESVFDKTAVFRVKNRK